MRERNTTSDNISYLIDDKKCLCQHEKLHPLTAIKVKCISEIMYIDLEGITQNTHLETSLLRTMNF